MNINIAFEDIKYLEKKYNEPPATGHVWELAQQGKTCYEIELALEKIKTRAQFQDRLQKAKIRTDAIEIATAKRMDNFSNDHGPLRGRFTVHDWKLRRHDEARELLCFATKAQLFSLLNA